VNTGGAEALVALVREGLAPASDKSLLDLYCGAGLFALSLAGEVARVTGVEVDPSAAADFRFNAQGLNRVEIIEATVQEAIPQIAEPVDLVVLDPPRSGAGRDVLADIARLAPQRIAYVSCDPATLARDARYLTDSNYHLVEVQPVDLFPQTFHVESVALFVKEN
jgi:tRNA/tmRNA/rRNA uracil-C5-methylase (TrmA/RlmC/RlmD family)